MVCYKLCKLILCDHLIPNEAGSDSTPCKNASWLLCYQNLCPCGLHIALGLGQMPAVLFQSARSFLSVTPHKDSLEAKKGKGFSVQGNFLVFKQAFNQ